MGRGLLEHSAARLNRVNCSGGQGVQHSSGTLFTLRSREEGGEGQRGPREWGGCEEDDAEGKKSSPRDTPLKERARMSEQERKSVCVCVAYPVAIRAAEAPE